MARRHPATARGSDTPGTRARSATRLRSPATRTRQTRSRFPPMRCRGRVVSPAPILSRARTRFLVRTPSPVSRPSPPAPLPQPAALPRPGSLPQPGPLYQAGSLPQSRIGLPVGAHSPGRTRSLVRSLPTARTRSPGQVRSQRPGPVPWPGRSQRPGPVPRPGSLPCRDTVLPPGPGRAVPGGGGGGGGAVRGGPSRRA